MIRTFDKVEIGWSRGDTFVSKAIQKLDDSYFNHVYWKFTARSGLILIYESHLKGGVQITPYEHFEKSKKVIDHHEIEVAANQNMLYEDCIPFHADGYDKSQIIRYFIWIRYFKRKNEKPLRLYNDKKFTCNEFVVTTGRMLVSRLCEADYSYTPERLFVLFNGKSSKEWHADSRS